MLYVQKFKLTELITLLWRRGLARRLSGELLFIFLKAKFLDNERSGSAKILSKRRTFRFFHKLFWGQNCKIVLV
jgi:hypothetical protein